MSSFESWMRNEPDREKNHTLKPIWLRGMPTQDEAIMRNRKQLYLLSIYGIGGCSVIELNGTQMSLWSDFAMGASKNFKEIKLLLTDAIPKAYKAVITDGKDCRGYFLGKHNARVRDTKTTESQVQLCLAREGELLDVLDRVKAGRLLMTNTRLLKSAIGKSLSKVGLIGFKDRQMEHAFMDFVPDAQIGEMVLVHRNIACESFSDDGMNCF